MSLAEVGLWIGIALAAVLILIYGWMLIHVRLGSQNNWLTVLVVLLLVNNIVNICQRCLS